MLFFWIFATNTQIQTLLELWVFYSLKELSLHKLQRPPLPYLKEGSKNLLKQVTLQITVMIFMIFFPAENVFEDWNPLSVLSL